MAQNTATTDGIESIDNIKADMAKWFHNNEYIYREEGNYEVEIVHEDEQYVVVADHSGGLSHDRWSDELDVAQEQFSEIMHSKARELCDYNWVAAYPVVFDKTAN